MVRHPTYTTLAFLFWAAAAPAPAPAQEPVTPDASAAPAGEPARWAAALGDPDGTLNIRVEPSAAAPIVIGVADGTALRNRGCRESEGRRWCQVETEGERTVVGWAAAEFLASADLPRPGVEPAAGDGAAAIDVPVPGTPFDDMGLVDCARRAEAPGEICEFGVVRAGDGSGTVTVFWPSGGSRVIRFERGDPTGFERGEADGDAELRALREGDRTTIVIGDERIIIPDPVIFGD